MAALSINHSTTTHQLHSRVHRTTMTMPTTRMAANCAKDDDNKTALAPFWTVDSVDSRRRPLLEWSFKSSKDAVAAAVDSRLRPLLLLELSFNSATAVAAFESTSGDIRQLTDCGWWFQGPPLPCFSNDRCRRWWFLNSRCRCCFYAQAAAGVIIQ